MGTITTYGYKRPANGDSGTWWSDLQYNIDRTDSHKHDGIDSPKINATELLKHIQTINADWILISNGNYYQNVALPSNFLFSTGFVVKFYINSGPEEGAEVILTLEKVTDNSFKLYTNDNTLTLKAVYA
ncbi:MAG: hypothetical protein ACK41T_00660 [Pseudobdellovibrio sp.]